MADQTALIAGLAGGLGGVVLLVGALAFCVYYQHKKMKKDRGVYNSNFVNPDAPITFPSTPFENKVDAQPLQTETKADINPETGQTLPSIYSAAIPVRTSKLNAVSPIAESAFLQPAMAFNPAPRIGEPFSMNYLPAAYGYGFSGPPPALPYQEAVQPGPSVKKVTFEKRNSWSGHPEIVYQTNQLMADPFSGYDNRSVMSDGEEVVKKKKKDKDEAVQFIVKKVSDKVTKKNKKKSKRRDDSSSESSSSSSSESSDSEDSDASTQKRYRIVQPGMNKVFFVEGNRKKNKKKGKSGSPNILTFVPQQIADGRMVTSQEPKLHADPVPKPETPPVQQPMIFVLPSACQHQQPVGPTVIQDYEVRPVSVPAQQVPKGASTFWSADGNAPAHPAPKEKKVALFNAGGSGGATAFETQERSARLGDDEDFSFRGGQMVQVGRSENYYTGSAGGSAGGSASGGCSSCETGGNMYAYNYGGSAGSSSAVAGSSSAVAGSSSAVAGSSRAGGGSSTGGMEEKTFTLNF